MASALTSIKATSNAKRLFFDVDPDDSTPTDVSWQDMRDYGYILVGFIRTIGTGALDGFGILANPNSDGSGTDVTVKTHAVASEPNAIPDYIWLEALASEFPPLGSNLRYASASVEFAVSTDEAIVYYELGSPRFPQQSLTADTIA